MTKIERINRINTSLSKIMDIEDKDEWKTLMYISQELNRIKKKEVMRNFK